MDLWHAQDFKRPDDAKIINWEIYAGAAAIAMNIRWSRG
jgi:hypothetical protein